MKKATFDPTPNLTENFDQLKMSSEIRSSDHSPLSSQLRNYANGKWPLILQIKLKKSFCKKGGKTYLF